MGCGESKHAVATDNSISKSKPSDSSENRTTSDVAAVNNPAKNNPVVTNTNNAAEASVQSQETKDSPSGEMNAPEEHHHDNLKDEENVKDIGQENVENVAVVEDEKVASDEEKAIETSADEDKETIESLISEGLSGKSEYHSPRAHRDDAVDDDKDVPSEESKTEPDNSVNVDNNEAALPVEVQDSAKIQKEETSSAEETIAEDSKEESTNN